MRLVLATLAALALSAAAADARVSVVQVPLSDPATQVPVLERLGLDVTHEVTPRWAKVITYGAGERALLRRSGFAFRVVVPDMAAQLERFRRADRRYAARVALSPLPSGRTEYRTYEDYLAEMDRLAAENPSLVRRVVLPERTVEGREITGLEISNQVNRTDDGRPAYVVMGVHHAREWASAEVNMEFARDLVARYGKSARWTRLLDNARVFVIPVINVDGFIVSRGDQTTGDPLWDEVYPSHNGANKRKNCAANTPLEEDKPCTERSGVDLNRNYGAMWGGNGASSVFEEDDYRGPAPFSEPETQAVHEFSQHLQITNFQTIHNVAALVLRPPGFRAQGLAPDEERLKELGDEMGAATGYSSEYGYELYEVTGATEDWNYVSQGAFGYTIELGGNGFQGPFQTNVVDQYVGTQGRGGTREALLLAGEQAIDTRDHAVLTGTAPAGRVLRLRKDFQTTTSPVCPVDLGIVDNVTGQVSTSAGLPYVSSCPVGLEPILIDDFVDTTLTVPESGTYEWHVGPSTRPFVAKNGGTEAWTLTCETPAGAVLETKQVTVGRGERLDVDLGCI
jgi:murein tripeptide amidase MpaA